MNTDVTAPAGRSRVLQVDPAVDERWDQYVVAHQDALVYHHSGWLRALQREYGQPPVGLVVEDATGQLRGVFPLMATKGLPIPQLAAVAGRRFSSLPRTPLAGPVADDRHGLAALLNAAIERTPAGAQLQLKPAVSRLDGLVDGLVSHPWRFTYVVELPAREEGLRFGTSRNHAAIKRAVDKARKEGVTVRPGQDLGDLRRWYRLYLETMRHHVVPARPLRLFDALWQDLRPQGMMQLLLAERDGELLAGLVLLMLGSTVFYGFNGAVRSAFAQRPNDLLHWEAIHAASMNGFRWYDLGEVAEGQEGLARFKRKWGGQPRRMQRWYYPAPPQPPSAGDSASGAVTGLPARVWRRLPLGATRLAGDVAYRFL